MLFNTNITMVLTSVSGVEYDKEIGKSEFSQFFTAEVMNGKKVLRSLDHNVVMPDNKANRSFVGHMNIGVVKEAEAKDNKVLNMVKVSTSKVKDTTVSTAKVTKNVAVKTADVTKVAAVKTAKVGKWTLFPAVAVMQRRQQRNG